jgi:hypothetical protein
MKGSFKMPKEYPENFKIAELAFLYQRVYDPISQRLTHLGPPPDEEWDESKDAFVGEYVDIRTIFPRTHIDRMTGIYLQMLPKRLPKEISVPYCGMQW